MKLNKALDTQIISKTVRVQTPLPYAMFKKKATPGGPNFDIGKKRFVRKILQMTFEFSPPKHDLMIVAYEM